MLQWINPACKVLTLNEISNAQSQHIRQLIHLEQLDVAPSDYLTDMLEICFHLKRLQTLKLTYCKLTQEQDFVYPELETLQLSYSKIYSDLPNCPNLKSLRLISNEYYNSVKIVNIIAKYAPTLERLVLRIQDYKPHTFTANDLIEALRECNNMQYLDIDRFLIKNLLSENMDSFTDVLKANGCDEQK